MKKMIPVHIRWMIRRDINEVCEIEHQCFEHPWSEMDFVSTLRNRNCIGMVAESNEHVRGYMIYELHKSRLHVRNLAVDPTVQRCSIGSQMIARMIGKLSFQGRNRLTIDVRETNLQAQLFLRFHGFEAVRILRDIYEDTDEDAYRMVYRKAEIVSW